MRSAFFWTAVVGAIVVGGGCHKANDLAGSVCQRAAACNALSGITADQCRNVVNGSLQSMDSAGRAQAEGALNGCLGMTDCGAFSDCINLVLGGGQQRRPVAPRDPEVARPAAAVARAAGPPDSAAASPARAAARPAAAGGAVAGTGGAATGGSPGTGGQVGHRGLARHGRRHGRRHLDDLRSQTPTGCPAR